MRTLGVRWEYDLGGTPDHPLNKHLRGLPSDTTLKVFLFPLPQDLMNLNPDDPAATDVRLANAHPYSLWTNPIFMPSESH